jgi:hypothetical protein
MRMREMVVDCQLALLFITEADIFMTTSVPYYRKSQTAQWSCSAIHTSVTTVLVITFAPSIRRNATINQHDVASPDLYIARSSGP